MAESALKPLFTKWGQIATINLGQFLQQKLCVNIRVMKMTFPLLLILIQGSSVVFMAECDIFYISVYNQNAEHTL